MKSTDKEKLIATYTFSFIYSNLTLLIGHPADRFKTALQINLDQPQLPIIQKLITGKINNLFRGFGICFWRQNTKIFHRTLIMSTLPKYIDTFNFNFILGCGLKGLVASCIDTIIISPFENIKVMQMKSINTASILSTAKYIYKKNHFKGFFIGPPQVS